MMVLSPADGEILHRRFTDLPGFLRPGDLVIVNDTAVMSCRLFARKPTGGQVEIFLLKTLGSLEWGCWFSPARGLKEGERLTLFSRNGKKQNGPEVSIVSLSPDNFRVRFFSSGEEREALEQFSEMPLPPYIDRPAPREEDRERYQTIFARQPGAVAAPTAGLHFTETTRKSLAEKGVEWAALTLHVGPGTFLPVKTQKVDEHVMHSEFFEIPPETRDAVRACQERKGKVLAVGTTALRALETWGLSGETRGWTDLYIRPGFQFKVVDRLLTNFHQPRSTLLILVSALAGREFILSAYQEAIRERYRLFSYGDCMLILAK
jgi:S-adenosylmethionine:tRNA ribosyltransferase-isomerase